MTEQLPDVGKIAGPDDVAPEGEVITAEHVLAYRRGIEEDHRNRGLPTDNLWVDSTEA